MAGWLDEADGKGLSGPRDDGSFLLFSNFEMGVGKK